MKPPRNNIIIITPRNNIIIITPRNNIIIIITPRNNIIIITSRNNIIIITPRNNILTTNSHLNWPQSPLRDSCQFEDRQTSINKQHDNLLMSRFSAIFNNILNVR